MKTYTVLYAEEVPHYTTHYIEAETDEQAIEAAKAVNWRQLDSDPRHDMAVCRRIVDIEDPEGKLIEEGLPLDNWFLREGDGKRQLLVDDAPAILAALEDVLERLEKQIADAGGAPGDETLAEATRALIAKYREQV